MSGPDGMTRRVFLQRSGMAAAGLSLLALGVGGCDGGSGGTTSSQSTGGSRKGGILRFAVSEADSAIGLDPALGLLISDTTASTAIFEPLVGLGFDRQVKPLLAETWNVSPDAREWTFKLRPGVAFHDGKPFTADDVAYTFERLLDASLGSGFYPRLSLDLDRSGIDPVDDHTIRFKLKRADALFVNAVAWVYAGILPRGLTDFTDANGTGPFMLKSFNPGKDWELERNPSYWRPDRPLLDGIRQVVISDQGTKLQSVVSGDFHVGDRIDPSLIASAKGSESCQLLVAPKQYLFEIAMDLTQKPFSDPRVAMAAKLVVDRSTMLKLVGQGYGTLASDAPVASGDPLSPQADVREQNLAQAQQLLAEAGYPNGIDITLYTAPVTGGFVDLAVAYKEMAAPAGIRVDVQQQPATTYFSDVWLKAPMYVTYWLRRHPNEHLVLGFRSDAPWNESKYRSDELDSLMDQAAATIDIEAQDSLFRDALRLVSDEAGTIIPFFVDPVWIAKKSAHDVRLDAERFATFDDAWLES